LKKHDRFLTRRHLMNALRRALRDKALRPKLVGLIGRSEEELETIDAGFVYARCRELGLDEPEDDDFAFASRRRRPRRPVRGRNSGLRPCAHDFLSWAVEAVERSMENPPAEGAEARATALAVRRFGLGGVCGPLLELARLYDDRRSFTEELWDATKDALGDPVEASATLLGVSGARVERALRRLTEVGIADANAWSRNGAEPDDYIEDWFECVYRPPVASEEELRERLVPMAPEPLLGLDAFAHLDERDDAVRLLRAAGRSREGVRVVFYGRAGTGKTEFAKTLARAGGARLYDLCASESQGAWGGERTDRRMDRSADKRNRLRMALALLRSEPGAAVLCDEVEDVLSSDAGSRRENHDLVENAPVPILFTGNDLSTFDEAMLRRFDLTIHFKAHSPTRRRSVVRRMLENSGIESVAGGAVEPLVRRLADELECPPGIIERAIRSTRLIQGSPETLFRFAERHERTVSTHIARPRLGEPVRAELPWKAFGHLGRGAEDFRKLVMAALCARRERRPEGRGVSFLAYGPPGCGKTEFCRTVAAEAGTTLYSVGQREHGPESRLPVQRRVSLEYAIEALADDPEAVILFDEIEDFVFGEGKHWLNGLVENSPVPLLFTANSIRALRWMPYFLDRLTYSLEFRNLPRGRRATAFRDLLRANGSAGMAPLAEELAADPCITPRQVRNAGLVACLSGGGADAARRAVREKARLLRGRGTVEAKAAEKYDFSLVHADPDLTALTDRIVKIGRRRMGILLDGPSGSGKSEYAKQLAKRMDLDPLARRASDLMGKYVGETEQRIADAFAEARATDSFLILDEADSFLADRRDAHRHWETSMVNEMLSQLETHDLPYAFTTNLADRLDPAVARRFLFRATFRFLDEARVRRAWEFFFGGACPTQVRNLPRLVPADFALVRERAEKLGFLDDADQIATGLVAQARDRNRAGRMGFRPVA
jgi:SpoVK/Ycf46/Vps4 family AAA+-type ATPase